MKGKAKFKRWMAVLLTFAMTASLSMAVFAEDETSPDSESMAVESVESTEMETADSAETVTASETVDIEETTADGESAESELEEQTELETIAEEVTNEVKLFSVSENDVCQIGETGYASLKEAFENANENDRIVLKKSVAADEIINVAKSVVLDLNGFTITNNVSGERLFNVSAPSFTVEGGTAGSGMIIPEENTGSYGFIKVIAASQVVLNGGEYSGNTDDGAFVRLFNQLGVGDASGSTITLNNVQATTNNSFLTTDPLTTDASTPTLHVNGGTYVTEGRGFGLDIIPPSPVSFTGVTVTAGSGPVIELSGGDAVFEDCTFDVTATTDNSHFRTTAVAVSWSGIATIKGGSYSSTGYGIYVYSSGGTIIVEDGDISGDVKAAEADADPGDGATSIIKIQGGNVKGTLGANNKPDVTIEVTGGKFDTDVSTYVPSGLTIQKNDDGSFSVIRLDAVYLDGVNGDDSQSGADKDNAVKSLEKAMQLVSENGTIYVSGTVIMSNMSDVSLSGVTIKRAEGFTKKMFLLAGNTTLTLSNVIFDGDSIELGDDSKDAPLIFAGQGTTLNIGEGTQLINNGANAVQGNTCTINMTGGIIKNNNASLAGGAMIVWNGTVNLTGGIIEDNFTEEWGGAICALDNSVVTMDGIDIRNNSAVSQGGAVYLEGNVSGTNTAKFIMKSGSITGNSAGEGFAGGGISAWSGAEIEISGGTIENNLQVDNIGTAIALHVYNGDTVLKLSGAPSISGNIALDDNEDENRTVIQVTDDFHPANPIEVFGNYYPEG